MLTEEQIKKAATISNHYGKSKQKMQAIQELTELILLLAQRPEQKVDHERYIENVIDEMADCYVMLEQLRLLYGINPIDIDRRITFKLNRQLKRIEEGR